MELHQSLKITQWSFDELNGISAEEAAGHHQLAEQLDQGQARGAVHKTGSAQDQNL
jgi:hypothetical protein